MMCRLLRVSILGVMPVFVCLALLIVSPGCFAFFFLLGGWCGFGLGGKGGDDGTVTEAIHGMVLGLMGSWALCLRLQTCSGCLWCS